MVSIEEAAAAVEEFDILLYFEKVSPKARVKVAETLMALVNWPRERVLYREDEYDLATKQLLRKPIPYVEPADRLRKFVDVMVDHVGTWPGLAEMRAIYCKMYAPADGVESDTCNTPGFTPEECESGSDVLSLRAGRTEDQKFLPGPGDEPIGDEFARQVQVIVAKKAMR